MPDFHIKPAECKYQIQIYYTPVAKIKTVYFYIPPLSFYKVPGVPPFVAETCQHSAE